MINHFPDTRTSVPAVSDRIYHIQRIRVIVRCHASRMPRTYVRACVLLSVQTVFPRRNASGKYKSSSATWNSNRVAENFFFCEKKKTSSCARAAEMYMYVPLRSRFIRGKRAFLHLLVWNSHGFFLCSFFFYSFNSSAKIIIRVYQSRQNRERICAEVERRRRVARTHLHS